MAPRVKTDIKRADIILLILVLLIAGVLFGLSFIQKSDGKTVLIEVDGKRHLSYFLSEIEKEKTVNVTTEYGSNTVVIEKDGVYVKNASCPDKIDVKKGKITKAGESIVCLPNRLIIYIEGESDADAISY